MDDENQAKGGEGSLNVPTKKRRLSRKEQKALKKKRRKDGQGARACTDQNNHEERTSKETAARLEKFHQGTSDSRQAEQDFLSSYEATPIPTWQEVKQKHQKCKSLGKWFPKAVILKSSTHYTNADIRKLQKQNTSIPKASILLFYQYVDPLWPESKVDLLIAYLIRVAGRRSNLGGRIRVAREGLNVTLSAVDHNGIHANTTLRHFAYDLKHFDPTVFAQTDFKYIDSLQADRHFKDLKIFPVQELVFYGFGTAGEANHEQAPLSKGGVHLVPKDFHAMLEQDSSTTVVVDVRNHYEAALGRFDGQQHGDEDKDDKGNKESSSSNSSSGNKATEKPDEEKKKGAEYIDPKMRKSTDFSRWLAMAETQEKLKGKNVMLFCTGGVRCERASAYLNNTIGSSVKGVYQLQGGIERYLQEFPNGGHWRGKNFVFDKREAIGAGDIDGDGGVVERHNKKHANSASSGIDTKCCLCDKPWDRYVGKKKCSTCGVPVLMCDACMSDKKKQSEMLARCPLCVEENVTVKAEEVEWTNNGLDIASSSVKNETCKATLCPSRAASSILKWGGGHAATKKDRRRFKNTPCRFGSECKRRDCFFAHPTKADS